MTSFALGLFFFFFKVTSCVKATSRSSALRVISQTPLAEQHLAHSEMAFLYP